MTIGFVGFGGGKLKELVHKCIVVSSTDYGQVEDIHLSLAHIASYLIREKIAEIDLSQSWMVSDGLTDTL